MRLKRLEIVGFKSFAKKAVLEFSTPVSSIVGPNGSGKSNVAEAMRFVLGEQSIKSMRGKRGEDLIFNGTQNVGRLNHAKVTVVFDNADRAFKIDFDEVLISREVFRDGTHQYNINGSQVRLKDVLELLASVHIGASSHHIISQGEADRILNASLKERKGMIEDALGLKIYHWRLNESEKKLIKTEENLKEIEMLRREITPHLRYLKKQVEKIERAHTLREELAQKYQEYLKREDVYLKIVGKRFSESKKDLHEKLQQIDSELGGLLKLVDSSDTKDVRLEQVSVYEQELRAVQSKRSDVNREVGKTEGMIEYEERRIQEQGSCVEQGSFKVSMEEVEKLIVRLEQIVSVENEEMSYEELKKTLDGMRRSVAEFREKYSNNTDQNVEKITQEVSEELKQQLEALQNILQDMALQEGVITEKIKTLQVDIEKDKGEIHEAERVLYEKKAVRAQVAVRLESLASEGARHSREVNDLEEEIRDGVTLIGAQVREFYTFEVPDEEVMDEPREKQTSRRRDIDRIKMRIEDLGGGGEDVMKEYKEVTERDEFLAKEVDDLKSTAVSLGELISDLNKQLDEEFQSGVTKINVQ
ncbi:MAG: AAA family ATPase, partial [Candidatus Pacebacteria bacterium]|nr:AAA family ATPase [Candidatus Paceibacterota bacterium]